MSVRFRKNMQMIMKIFKMNLWGNIMNSVNHGDRQFKDKNDFDNFFNIYSFILFIIQKLFIFRMSTKVKNVIGNHFD